MALAPSALRAQEVVVSTEAHQQFVFAYRLLQRGEDALAAEAFDDFLRSHPADLKRPDALYYRALLARRAGNPTLAQHLLHDAPAPTLVAPAAMKLLHAQALADLARFDQALAVLEPIKLDGLDPPTQAALLYLRGLCQRSDGNLPAARQTLTEAAAIDSPLRPAATLDLARTLIDQRQDQPALAALQRAIDAADPAVTPAAARLAGDLAYRRGDYDRAVRFYHTVVTAHASSVHFGPAVIGILWSRYSAAQYEAALSYFDSCRQALDPSTLAAALYLVAAAQQELGRHDDALKSLQSALDQPPALPTPASKPGASAPDPAPVSNTTNTSSKPGASAPDPASTSALTLANILYRIALSQSALGRGDDAVRTLDRLAQSDPHSPRVADGQLLLADLEARRGDRAAAEARLKALIDRGDKTPAFGKALLQRARLYESADNLQSALSDYLTYLAHADDASHGPAGEDRAAIDRATLRLIDLYLRLARFDDAVAKARSLLSRPDLPPLLQQEALLRRGLSLARLNQPEPALADLDRLLSDYPQTSHRTQALYYRGLLRLNLRRYDDALSDLAEVAAAAAAPTPMRINAHRLRAIRQREDGRDDAAARSLTDLQALADDPADALSILTPAEALWMGRRLVQQGQHRPALRYLAPLIDHHRWTPRTGGDRALRSEAVLHASVALRSLNDPEAAISGFREVIQARAGFEAPARLELAHTLALGGKPAEALAQYEQLFNIGDARIEARALHGSAIACRRLAALQHRAADPRAAEASLAKARMTLKRLVVLYDKPELQPLPTLALFELARLADELRQPDAANDKALAQLAADQPDSPEGRFAAALALLRQGRAGEALFLLRKLQDPARSLDPRLAELIADRVRILESLR